MMTKKNRAKKCENQTIIEMNYWLWLWPWKNYIYYLTLYPPKEHYLSYITFLWTVVWFLKEFKSQKSRNWLNVCVWVYVLQSKQLLTFRLIYFRKNSTQSTLTILSVKAYTNITSKWQNHWNKVKYKIFRTPRPS